MNKQIEEGLQRTKKASRKLATLPDAKVKEILYAVADAAWEAREAILQANKLDLARMDESNPKYDRLLLSDERIASICEDLKKVAGLESPLNKVLEEKTLESGLHISRVSVPIGVVGIIYESRPNVTFDVFALCMKSGNAAVLKGSQDAKDSNLAIVEVIKGVLSQHDLADIVYLAPADRAYLADILNADQYIHCIIPRGGQGLINYVRENARVPVIETGAGIVHTYVDASADLEKARNIVQNAKTRRVSVCNALDCLVIHEAMLAQLPHIMGGMDTGHQVVVYGDQPAMKQLHGNYTDALLHEVSDGDYAREWLDYKMTIKTVKGLDEALDHIATYGSGHSETIVAEDQEVIDHYLKNVDAACVYANASTAFSDGGQFGLGAEIGISTQKLHARGPMGLAALTSYKWIVRGNGHVRP